MSISAQVKDSLNDHMINLELILPAGHEPTGFIVIPRTAFVAITGDRDPKPGDVYGITMVLTGSDGNSDWDS